MKFSKNIRLFVVSILLILIATGGLVYFFKDNDRHFLSPYPDGKNFAFTIADDAHKQTVEKIRPIYEFLYELGLRTTIAVYIEKPSRTNGIPDVSLHALGHDERTNFINNDISLRGDTLEQKDYLEYIKELHEKGFEIAIHTVSSGNDFREITIEGYEKYKKIFGEYPKMNIMHSNNLENVYWGAKVFNSKIAKWIIEDVIGIFYSKTRFPFEGEDPESPYFFGDILKEKTKYVRLWGTRDINTLRFNPSMPYHDPQKPYVNYWYSFSEGHTARVFNRLLNDENIEKLYEERGASIVYTHFASGFISKSEKGENIINPVAETQLRKLAHQKDGWFVPASILLDRLLLMKNVVLFDTDSALIVSNLNDSIVRGVTLVVKSDDLFYDEKGGQVFPNEEGEIVIGNLTGHSSAVLYKNGSKLFLKNAEVTWRENINLVSSRIVVWVTTMLDF